MKRLSILCILLALFASAILCANAENLLVPPDYYAADENNCPENWSVDGYYPDLTAYSVQLDPDGETVLSLNSLEANDARWIQIVPVKPDTEYLLTCRVKAEGCSETGDGANLSILNSRAQTESVYDTDGEWVLLELGGITGVNQTELTVALRLGGYGRINTGKAWFKSVSLVQTQIAEEADLYDFSTYAPRSEEPDFVDYSDWESESSDTLPERNTETVLLYTFLLCLIMLAVYTALRRAKRPEPEACRIRISGLVILGVILIAAAVIRTVLAYRVRGYCVDINCFLSWSESFRDKGFDFYADGGFCDYPPLYMMLLGGIGCVREWLGIAYNSAAHIALIKSIPVLCDLLAAAFAYFLYVRKGGQKRALILCAAIAFNPAWIIDSSAWGQVDSVLALELAVCVYLAVRGRWEFSLPVYALCVLTKPQALMFGPIGLVALIVDIAVNRAQWKRGVIGLIAAAAVLFACCLPFAIRDKGITGAPAYRCTVGTFLWLWERLFGAANGYPYLTVNACNLYVLLGKNWAALENSDMTVFSYVMLAAAYLYAGALCVISKKRKCLPLAGAVLLALIFAFAPMMHERYLFPALILSLLAYLQYRDRRLLVYFILTTCTQFLNIYLVLRWGTVQGFEAYGHLQWDETFANGLVSALNVAGALYLSVSALSMVLTNKVHVLGRNGEEPRRSDAPDWRLKLKRFDYLAMAIVTLVYGGFAFTNLGVTKAPQSQWRNTAVQEQVVFDLGEVKTYRMTYFHGITNTKFTVALSNDGEHWTEENYAAIAEGSMYTWIWYVPSESSGTAVYTQNTRAQDTGEGGAAVTYASYADTYPLQTSRYVRITAMGRDLLLNEVAFLDTDTNEPLRIVSVSGTVEGSDYSALCDEQDTVCAVPSYLNGMYFDEIYHARTAYELLNDVRPILEWSHPHLGKLLIALGIRIFGMTPFGWRFTGALFGCLMLPVIYLLVKQLTGKSNLSLIAMLLLSLDSMHFTQTRIATVDTYAVFFILLMYLFMIRYWKMNLLKQPLWRTWIPLGLSGISMGLACASKWTGIYASAGLAILFFVSVGKRIAEYIRLRREDPLTEDKRIRKFPLRLCATFGFCVIAFIVIPLLIYYFSYYPHFSAEGGLTVDKVVVLQKQMFDYHSQLVDDHYFKSPWYEWPVIGKPMWYYSADIAYVGRGVVSSISCMGNPAVWWTGLAALLLGMILLAVQKHPGEAIFITAIGFLSQFLPWVLVPRSTFIYHYFASVPFIILFTVLLLEKLGRLGKFARGTALVLSCILVAAALVLFLMFYPLESGYPCSYEYALKLRWFDWYNFALQ